MYSNTILNEFPTFTSQYAVELLHSLGSKFDTAYISNENLRNLMIDSAKNDQHCFYQLALHAYHLLKINDDFDLCEVFNEENFNKIRDVFQQNSNNSTIGTCSQQSTQYVATVYVTPTVTSVMPMQWTQGHRALRHPAFNGVDDFCLVYFKPDAPNRYVNECFRYREVLESGITICNRRYHFFGVSNSQLRGFSYWFIRANSMKEIEQKRRQLLEDFTGNFNIGKYVARLGLWFSKSDPAGIQLEYLENPEEFQTRVDQGGLCVTQIDDIERNGYCFTDGNGFISKGLAKLVAERLEYLIKSENSEIYPSAYQIRMAGCKGLVIIDPSSSAEQYYIKIRSSMKKFECDRWDLEICEPSRPMPTRLNNQITILMSDLGVQDIHFLNLQQRWLTDRNIKALSTEDVLKNRIPLPVNECRYIFGCSLESKLAPGQCFIRYQVLDEHGKPKEQPEFQTVVGPVVVTKNPCPYAGDIITLEAVDIPELYCLQDVLVFSTQGDRPDFDKISGSDLDGDHYFAYWGKELQLPQTVEPLDYRAKSGSLRSTSVTPLDAINYCMSIMGATSYGEIHNLHAMVVDRNKKNHPLRTCQPLAIELANMFSAAIDAGKTGYQIDRARIKQIRKDHGFVYPDFLMKENSYPSQLIVGELHRKALKFKKENPTRFIDGYVDDPTNYSTQRMERNCRLYVKLRSSLHINPRTISQELRTIFGGNAPSELTIEKWFFHHQKQSTNYTTVASLPLQMVPTSTTNESWIREYLHYILSLLFAFLLYTVTMMPF